jgi:kinesin family member 5
VIGKPLIANLMEGFNSTLIAYGQTSSGKTYTIQGYDNKSDELKGVIPRLMSDLFSEIAKQPETMEYRLRVSIVELYNEKLKDLIVMSNKEVRLRESSLKGVYIQGTSEVDTCSEEDAHKLIQLASKNRMVYSTMMSMVSSRSHLVFLM